MALVIVIGAGMGGLAAAARLAAGGHRVTVLEAANTIGGKAGVLERSHPSGTFRFDTGPTLLTMPQVFEELFADTGDPLASVVTLRRVEPAVRYRFGDGTVLDMTADAGERAARMDHAFGPGTGSAWAALLERGARIWRATEGPVLRQPLTAGSALRSGTRWGDIAAIAPTRTLRQLGRRYLSDPRQRAMLDRYATYAGSDPRRAPAALAVIPFLEAEFGSWYVEGGIRSLVEAVANRALLAGATIRTDTEVRRIGTAAGRVVEVETTDGAVLPADIVVSDADASDVLGRLLNPVRRWVPRVDSLSGFVVLLGVRGATPGLAQHNVLFGSGNYDDEFDAVFGRPGRPVADPVLYVSAPDDPGLAPAGYEAWFVLVNAARHGTSGAAGTLDWDAPGLAAAQAERVVTALDRRGLPVRERIVLREVLTPADLQRQTGAPGGAIYGSALHGRLGSFRRPGNVTPVRGLYLVGGSAHPGGGLPLVTLSAAIVSNLIGPA